MSKPSMTAMERYDALLIAAAHATLEHPERNGGPDGLCCRIAKATLARLGDDSDREQRLPLFDEVSR